MPEAMGSVYLGIDCGATTSKVAAIDATGESLSDLFLQRSTGGDGGPDAIIETWTTLAERFLGEIGKTWVDVAGVGLAIPGPYRAYGVLGKTANLPESLDGWTFRDDLEAAVAVRAGRSIPVATANDGQLAGLAEARLHQSQQPGSVLVLAPGSGLGASFVHANGTLLSGDHQAAVILSHMPAPVHALGLPLLKCGCGRDWGCIEMYTTLAGLGDLLEHALPLYPDHPYAKDEGDRRSQVLSLRSRAQEGDALAQYIFDIQAKALGYAVAIAGMAYDPTHVVIGGGLMDPEATTADFRKRYLARVQEHFATYAWVDPKEIRFAEAVLGERSQAVGAALLVRGAVNPGA